jgi:phage recombination protein Bet
MDVKPVVFNAEDRRLIREMVNAQWKAAHEARNWTGTPPPVPTITDAELEQLITRASLSGLSPLAGHIYATRRENRMVMVVSIDALRLVANRTGCYAPGDDTRWDFGTAGDTLVSSTVYVKKLAGALWHQYSATAFMEEYAQRYKSGSQWVLGSMWARMPRNQLAKCAEALALRRGFPQELAGLYVQEELDASDPAPAYRPENSVSGPAAPSAAPNIAALAQQTITPGEPNRGHGQEGKPQTVPVSNTPAVAPAVAAADDANASQQQAAADRAKWEGIRAKSKTLMGKVIDAVGKTATGKDKNPFAIFSMEDPNGATRKLTCFDQRFLNTIINQAKGKNAVIYYVVNKKGNGQEYMNLTDIGELAGVPYWMGLPVHPDGITDEDIPF